jgi:hypothetical protein
MREQHLTGDVALNHKLRSAVHDAKIVAAFDQHHLLAVRIVKTGDLALKQLERRGLEVDSFGIETGERTGDSINLKLIVGVVTPRLRREF